jgi:hypothetical protein
LFGIESDWWMNGMNTLTIETGALRIERVRVSDVELAVDLEDGRTVIVPVAWYPRLALGTKSERNNWRLIGKGHGINWPDLDEDISAENLISGSPSGESQRSFQRWLDRRSKQRQSKRAVAKTRTAP